MELLQVHNCFYFGITPTGMMHIAEEGLVHRDLAAR
jgi:hypothetical protein